MKIALNTYHPAVAVLPFAAAIGFSMLTFHPVYSVITLASSVALAVKLNGQKAIRLLLRFCMPIYLVTILINTAFNKNGVTVMFYIGDWAIISEGFYFGLCSGAALCAILLWFSCYTSVIDSEKFLFLTSRFSPNAALLVSMTLGQVSKMTKKVSEISDAQIGIYGEEQKKLSKRLRMAMLKISVLLSWSMEDSVQTADSMHARGYGTGRMTKMNPYIFGRKDRFLLAFVLVFMSISISLLIAGKASFRFFPSAETVSFDPVSVFGYFSYFFMLSLPMAIEIKEGLQWRFYMSGI